MMTTADFQPIFAKLRQAYNVKMSDPQIASYYDELKSLHLQDFQKACSRLPANEPRFFPNAKVIRDYTLDEQESRLHAKKQQEYRREPVAHDPNAQAFVRLIVKMIQVGKNHPNRLPLIQAFQRMHATWLATQPYQRDFLEAEVDRLIGLTSSMI